MEGAVYGIRTPEHLLDALVALEADEARYKHDPGVLVQVLESLDERWALETLKYLYADPRERHLEAIRKSIANGETLVEAIRKVFTKDEALELGFHGRLQCD